MEVGGGGKKSIKVTRIDAGPVQLANTLKKPVDERDRGGSLTGAGRQQPIATGQAFDCSPGGWEGIEGINKSQGSEPMGHHVVYSSGYTNTSGKTSVGSGRGGGGGEEGRLMSDANRGSDKWDHGQRYNLTFDGMTVEQEASDGLLGRTSMVRGERCGVSP
ncbi:hypothetical protein BGZ63DRAFT_101459 [Mariannaea sp. PMI_226]|nr:hypothetical protein BGZ63DRAFT_101459 [Mariannaea sp. PMI_226]